MRFAPWLVAALASNVFALAACGDDGGSSNLTGFTVGDVDVSTAEDTPISVAIPVHAGSTSQLTVTIATQPQHGTVTATEGDVTTYSYTPAANYDGPDTFTATVTDGTNTATGTVNITVTPVDDAPAAGSAMFTTPLNTALTIQTSALLATDTDIENDPLTIVSVSDALNGTVALSGDTVTFTPNTQFFGAATFTYGVSDGHLTSTGLVTIAVGGNNHAPVAVNDSATTPENTPLVLGAATLTGNDTDADGNALRITAVENAQHGTVALDTSSNTVTFTPDNHFHGSAQFDYTIDDGNGGTDIGTVVVTVTHVNQNPVANPDSLTVAQGTIGTVNVLANDSDADGDGLTLASVTQGANGAVTFAGGVASYAPNPGFTGADSFTYTISDGNGGTATGTVSVTVVGVNHSPIANGDAMTVSENTAGSTNVLANDSDPDGDAIVISAITNAANGVTSFAGGVATYTPNANFVGADSFTYTISDNRGGTATATVTVNVVPVDRAPVATNDLLSTPQNVAGTVNVTANDSDPDGDALSVSNFTQPSHGAVTFANSVATYTPAHNFSGNDSFTYAISDGRGGAATGVVSIQVTHVNQAPVAQTDTLGTEENTPGSVDVTSNDSDADGDILTISSFTQPAHGTVTFSNSVANYVPLQNFFGTDSFTYTVSDGHGASATAFVNVTVTQGAITNHAPDAIDHTLSVHDASSPGVDLLAGDSDPDSGDTITLQSVTQGAHGTVTTAGTVASYAPNEAQFEGGAGTDSFSYTIVDSHGATATATVTVNVHNALPDPGAPQSFSVHNQNVTVGNVLTGASDADGDTITLVGQFHGGESGPAHGTVQFDGTSAVYHPNAHFVGNDQFQYTISDGHGGTAIGTVQIQETDQAPGTQDQTVQGVPDSPEAISIFLAESDGDADRLTLTFTQGKHGAVAAVGAAEVTYTPSGEGGFTPPDSFTYTVTDPDGESSTSTVTLIGPCGNGQIDPGEECDDGNATGGDGCEATCLRTCGDFTTVNGATFQPDSINVDRTNGSCFAFYFNGTSHGGNPTYAQAVADCKVMGGHLPTLVQFDEELGAIDASFATPWIGLNDITGGGEQWITGEPLETTLFDGGQPSGGSCVFIDNGFNWGANDCSNQNTRVQGLECEFDLFPKQNTYPANNVTAASNVVTADFNDDGIADVASFDPDFGTVEVMLGDGLGGLHPQGPIHLGFEPTALAAGDLDADNHADLVVVGEFTNTIEVFINAKDGTFTDFGNFSTAASGEGGATTNVANQPVVVGIVDLDQDGANDIVVGNHGDNSLGVLFNNEGTHAEGDLDFSSPDENVDLQAPPVALAVGAIDQSRNPGVALVTPSSGAIKLVTFGVTTPGFSVQSFDDPDDDTPDAVVIGDIDRDGQPDIAYGHSDATVIGIIIGGGEGGGEGGFVPNGRIEDFDVDSFVTAMAFDANADALVLIDSTASTVTFDGAEGIPFAADGSFFPLSRTGVPGGVASLAIADFDGDGVADVIATSAGSSQLTQLTGTGTSYGPSQYGNAGSNPGHGNGPNGVAADDFNHDGFADLVVVNSADNSITVALGSSNGFHSQNLGVGTDPAHVATGDFNGDGFADLAVTNSVDGTVSVLLNDRTGGFAVFGSFGAGGAVDGIAIADFDGDGANDVAVTVDSRVGVLLGDGNGNLGAPSLFDTGGGGTPVALAVGNLDALGGSTTADLVVGDLDGQVTVLLNTTTVPGAANLAFGGGILILQTDQVQAVAVGDLDNDGTLDVVSADADGTSVTVQFNNGFGDFGGTSNAGVSDQNIPVGEDPTGVVIADVDGDGVADIVAANIDSNTVSVVLNEGTSGTPGDFGNSLPFAVGAKPASVAVGDFDKNGHLDLVVTDNRSDGFEILKSPR